MNETDAEARRDQGGTDSERVLRAKYLDYCSARVADALLSLSPDEMYVLAKGAASSSEMTEPLSFSAMVDLTTKRIYENLALPTYEEWVQAYREDPEQFESYLLGFWESESSRGPNH